MSSNADPFLDLGFKPNPPSKGKSVASAGLRGLLEGASSLRVPGVSLPQTANLAQAEAYLDRVAPVRDEMTEKVVRRAAKLTPTVAIGAESIPAKAAQLALSTAGGQIAKSLGAGSTGQAIGEIGGLIGPSLFKGAKALVKGGEVQTLPSGLQKPRVLDRKAAGTITKYRQENALNQLNQQAKQLTEKSLKTRLPILEQVEKGVDFEGQFSKGFSELQDLAKKANPNIDIKPVTNLIDKTIEKYVGIPKLHPEAKKITSEIKAFRKRPAADLDSLLRTYRSNNQKIKNIFETSRITGAQKEYVDFLTDMNRSIAESFKSTLPEDSYFVRQFENLNKEYGQYKAGLKTKAALEPILGGNPTAANLKKILDPKSQKKLELAMGKEGAQEIRQIAQDLDSASEAIKSIPKKDIPKWSPLLLASILAEIPKGLKALLVAKKAKNIGSWLYGSWLSSPETRKAYKEALNAIKTGNLGAYSKAAKILVNDDSKEKLDEWEELGFISG